MTTTERKSPANGEDGAPGPAGRFEASAEETKAILRARAKSLAHKPDEKKAAGESIEALAFLLAHETYAIETPFIREVHPLADLTPLPCTPAHVLGIVNIRGRILTVIDMKRFFGLPEKGITDLNRVIVVRNETMELGILADEILGILNIPISGLHPPPRAMTGIREEHVKGVTGERLILMNMESFLNDGRLIVHEEVAS